MRIKEPADVVEIAVKLTWKIGTNVAGFALRNTIKAGKNVLKGTFGLTKKAAVFGFHKLKEKREERKREIEFEKEEYDYDKPMQKPMAVEEVVEEKVTVINIQQKVIEKQKEVEEPKLPGTFDVSNEFANLCKERAIYYQNEANKAAQETDEFASKRQENFQKLSDLNFMMRQAIMYDGGKDWDDAHRGRIKDFKEGKYQLNEGVQQWSVDKSYLTGLNKAAHFGEFSAEVQTYDNVMETTMADVSKLNFMIDFSREKGDEFAEKYITQEMDRYISKNMNIIAEMQIKNEPLDKPYKDEYDYYSSIASMQESNVKDKEMKKTINVKKAKGQGIADFAKVFMANKKEKEKQKEQAVAASKTTKYSKLQQAAQAQQAKPKKTVDLSM